MSALNDKGDFRDSPHVGAPGQWIVMSNNDVPWGPFESAAAADTWARQKWPAIPSYDENDGGGYWEVRPLEKP